MANRFKSVETYTERNNNVEPGKLNTKTTKG